MDSDIPHVSTIFIYINNMITDFYLNYLNQEDYRRYR